MTATRKTSKASKIDAIYTFANARHWKQIERFDVTENQIAEACGWKDARNIQFGNIFNRLRDLGEVELGKDLAQAIKWANA